MTLQRPPFEARYPALCVACDEWISPGALIRKTEDGYVHDDCEGAIPGTPERVETPCLICWMTSCDCEEYRHWLGDVRPARPDPMSADHGR